MSDKIRFKYDVGVLGTCTIEVSLTLDSDQKRDQINDRDSAQNLFRQGCFKHLHKGSWTPYKDFCALLDAEHGEHDWSSAVSTLSAVNDAEGHTILLRREVKLIGKPLGSVSKGTQREKEETLSAIANLQEQINALKASVK
jgi:hypothetical protein